MKEPRAGQVRLDPTAFVAPGAVVLGEVEIGPRASVWFNTVVRGDVDSITLGEASNLQDNSTVHVDAGLPVRIGARVTVGHRAIVHGCVIEDDCLIGMGSVLLSGCRIGAGSYIGASSLVLEGMEIPSGSVALGSPARVTGSVGERHRDGIRHGSETYAALAQDLMRRGYARPVSRNGEMARDRGQMTLFEWSSRLRALQELPERMRLLFQAGRENGPGTQAPSAIVDLLDSLRWLDGEVRNPIVDRLLQGQEAWCDLPATRPETQDGDFEAKLQEWSGHRAGLVRRLDGMGPDDWLAIARHRTRGPFHLAELLREWVEEDSERFQRLLARGRS